jgi:hypothetical protein
MKDCPSSSSSSSSSSSVVALPIKKFLAFYGTLRFITEFTVAHHWFVP